MKNSRIIFLTVFVCASLMSSLFIYHLQQKPVRSTLTAERGLIFPIPRDIQRFELVSSDEKKFSLQNLYGHWTLLFFGFTHCSQVCPNTLGMISKVYGQLHNKTPNLQVVLISVDPERDSPDSLKKYTRTFNQDFIGVSGKINELRKLQSQLGIYAEREDNKQDNYQIQHTPSILLINPQAKYAGLFRYGLTPTEFIKAYEESMQLIH